MDPEMKKLVDTIRQVGYQVHVYFGPGFPEKVYENALLRRLAKSGLKVEKQVEINVHDEDGYCVGKFRADLIVEDLLILELKAAKDLTDGHMAQLLGYLRATKIKDGLLINFGADVYQIRKLKNWR